MFRKSRSLPPISKSTRFPAFTIIGVSILQPNKHRLCLSLLQYSWRVRLPLYPGIREDLVDLLFTIPDAALSADSCRDTDPSPAHTCRQGAHLSWPHQEAPGTSFCLRPAELHPPCGELTLAKGPDSPVILVMEKMR